MPIFNKKKTEMKVVLFSLVIVNFSVSLVSELKKRTEFYDGITKFNLFFHDQMSKVLSLEDYNENQLLYFLSELEV